MDGTASYAPVISYLAQVSPETEFRLVDIGCSGGIDGIWRWWGSRLRTLGVDPNLAEVERLRGVETHPGIEYLAMFAGLPSDHPFAQEKAGRGDIERSPWARLSVARSQEIMKSERERLSPSELVAANLWSEMKLSEQVVVVPEYLRARGIDSVDFLKIDVDGKDFEILNSFDAALDGLGVLGAGIEVTFPGSACDTANTFHNTDRFMKARGFELFNLSVCRYSLLSLPSRYMVDFPTQTEFGRPVLGDALYIRDLGSLEYDEFTARLHPRKLLNLIGIFAAFNLPDCAAEIALRFRDRIWRLCDVDRVLDLLAVQAQGAIAKPATYREYMERFEARDPMFFTWEPIPTPDHEIRRMVGELRIQRETLAEREREVARLSDELHAREGEISSMKSSKFWKLRTQWFAVKRLIRWEN